MPQLIASVEGVEIKHVYLKNDRTTLGRRPYNDIVFDNLVVSGEHCVFELKGIADVYLRRPGQHQRHLPQRPHDQVARAAARQRHHQHRQLQHPVPGHFASTKKRPSKHDETTAMSLDATGPARHHRRACMPA
jgi:hypothetical protein